MKATLMVLHMLIMSVVDGSHMTITFMEIGLNFNIGKGTWKKSPDMEAINTQHQAALDALNARLQDAEWEENARS